jgi:hypothetical protein
MPGLRVDLLQRLSVRPALRTRKRMQELENAVEIGNVEIPGP